jgi:hypothetical protein
VRGGVFLAGVRCVGDGMVGGEKVKVG